LAAKDLTAKNGHAAVVITMGLALPGLWLIHRVKTSQAVSATGVLKT